jgi:hypothetical protein
MHLVPRWRDDRLQRPWAMIPADPMSLDAVAGRLRTD